MMGEKKQIIKALASRCERLEIHVSVAEAGRDFWQNSYEGLRVGLLVAAKEAMEAWNAWMGITNRTAPAGEVTDDDRNAFCVVFEAMNALSEAVKEHDDSET